MYTCAFARVCYSSTAMEKKNRAERLSDNLLILLNVHPVAYNMGISRDEITLQIGRNWDEIKELIGVFRAWGWVSLGRRIDADGNPTHDYEYWLTPDGVKELRQRIKQATRTRL